MNLVSRISLILYLNNMKQVRHLRKYGHLVHVNHERQYVVLYIDNHKVDQRVTQLMKLKYVEDIDGSPYKNLKRVYEKEKHEFS